MALPFNSCGGLWGALGAHIRDTIMQCSNWFWFSVLVSRTRPFPKMVIFRFFSKRDWNSRQWSNFFNWTSQNAVMPQGGPN